MLSSRGRVFRVKKHYSNKGIAGRRVRDVAGYVLKEGCRAAKWHQHSGTQYR